MEQRPPLRSLLLKLVAIPVLMFGFGYLLVPLYDVFCEVTGLNGKTGELSAAEASLLVEDKQRLVNVQFVASVNENGPWEFRPTVTSMKVHPGKPYTTRYFARNQQGRAMVSQSIPSVAPLKASPFFKKTECFCFVEQRFNAEETREMPLTFVINPALPQDVDTVVLSYTLFTKY